jgi:hypothetical protein
MAISDMSPALQRALAHKQRMAIAWRPYAKPTPAPVALASQRAPVAIPLVETRSSAVVLDDAALADWADGLTTRVGLQAELTWVGLNDGYVDAGGNDVAIPYLGLYWILGPVIKQHCFQCPEIANGSPYDPPGKGGHTIDQSPGDGGTVCGAGCKCWLEYGLPLVSVPKNYAWSNNVFPGPGKATAEIGAQQLQRQAASYSWQETMLLNPESEYLSDAQKGALDLFRAKWFAWEDVRGTLPQAPDMFAGADAAQSLQDLDTFWETLTAQQSNILIDLQEAIGAWNDATAEANGLLDASLDDGADGGDDAEQLAEAGADEAIQLFSFGRAFGGAGAAGRGAHGLGSAFDSLHPRGFHGKFRFVNGGHHAGVHEHTSAQHHGDEEHGGGQGHESNRASREKSPNEGSARRSGAKAKGESPERVSERVAKASEKMRPARNKDEELVRFNQLRQHENALTGARERAPANSDIRHTLTQQLGHIRVQRQESGQNLIHKKQEQYDNENAARDFAANRQGRITRAARRLVKAQKAANEVAAGGAAAHSAKDSAVARELSRAAEAFHSLHPAVQNPEHYLAKAPAAKKAAKPQKSAEEKLVTQRTTQLARAKSQNQAGYSEHLRSTSIGGMAAYRMPKAEWFGPGGPHAMQVRAAQLNLANARTLAKGDTAWKGEEHPPFSKSEFLRATLKPMNSRQQGHNPGFTTKIGEATYHIKLVQRDTALASETAVRFIKGSENAAYQAHAEQAATEIGHLLGVGEHMVDAHSFQVGNNHFVATKFQTGVKPLGDQEKGATPAKEASLFKTIGEGGAARLMLHEYLTGNGDAHAANVLTSAKTGEVKIIDFGRAFTQPGALMQGSHSPTRPVVNSWFRATAAKLGIKGVSQKLVTEAPQKGAYKAMHIPHEAVQHALGQESHVIGILHAHGLDAAVKTTQARFNVLRQLGNDTSLQHFDELQIKAFVSEGSQGRGAVDFSERRDDEAIQLFSIGGALRGLLGGGRGAHGIGSAFDSLHPRGFHGMFRLVNGGHHAGEGGQREHAGNAEHAGGQRGASKEERSPNKGAKRRVLRGKVNDSARTSRLARMAKRTGGVEKSPNEGAARRVLGIRRGGGARPAVVRPAIERTAGGHVVEHVAQRVAERGAERLAARKNLGRGVRKVLDARDRSQMANTVRSDAQHAYDRAVDHSARVMLQPGARKAEMRAARRDVRVAQRRLGDAKVAHEAANEALGKAQHDHWNEWMRYMNGLRRPQDGWQGAVTNRLRGFHSVAATGNVHPNLGTRNLTNLGTRNLARELPRLPSGAREPEVGPHGRIDENGQRTPFTRAQFAHALSSAKRVADSGANDTLQAHMGGKDYFIKRITYTDTQRGTGVEQGTREVAAIHLARAVGMKGAAPANAYHLYHLGEHYVVSEKVEGKPVAALNRQERELFHEDARGSDGQKLLMYEYLVGMGDRHSGNLLYDAATHHTTEIDFGLEFGLHTDIPWARGVTASGGFRNPSKLADAFVSHSHGGNHESVPLDGHALKSFVGTEHAAVTALKKVGMSARDIRGVQSRYDVLRTLSQLEHPTMADWINMGVEREMARPVEIVSPEAI